MSWGPKAGWDKSRYVGFLGRGFVERSCFHFLIDMARGLWGHMNGEFNKHSEGHVDGPGKTAIPPITSVMIALTTIVYYKILT